MNEKENQETQEDHKKQPINGTCCACGNSKTKDSVCLKREEGVHCDHWWGGTYYHG